MEVLEEFFYWLLDILFEYIFIPLVSPVLDALPTLELSSQFNAFLSYCGFVDDWVPMFYGLSCFGIYISFIVIMITIKLTVKLFIPTVG